MSSRLLHFVFSFLFFAIGASIISGCPTLVTDESGGDAPWDGNDKARIVLLSLESKMILGYFEKKTIKVRVEEIGGGPIRGVPVSASFIGPAHNGNLEQARQETDEIGEMVIEFTAPDKELEFEIRLSCPLAEESLFIP